MTKSNRAIKAGGVAVAAFALASVIGAGPAAAYSCKVGHNHYKQGVGMHPVPAVAQDLAKASWTQIVKAQYGMVWSVWDIAKSKQMNCAAAGGGMQTCVAVARPCKYVVQ